MGVERSNVNEGVLYTPQIFKNVATQSDPVLCRIENTSFSMREEVLHLCKWYSRHILSPGDMVTSNSSLHFLPSLNVYFSYIYACVCLFIYIYSHPQTDCFVISQHFSVARRTRFSKPCWLLHQLEIQPYSNEETRRKRKDLNTYVSLGMMVRVFANGPGDHGSILGRVIRKIQKIVLDAALLNTQHFKVWIMGKVEQSREWCSALPYTLL